MNPPLTKVEDDDQDDEQQTEDEVFEQSSKQDSNVKDIVRRFSQVEVPGTSKGAAKKPRVDCLKMQIEVKYQLVSEDITELEDCCAQNLDLDQCSFLLEYVSLQVENYSKVLSKYLEELVKKGAREDIRQEEIRIMHLQRRKIRCQVTVEHLLRTSQSRSAQVIHPTPTTAMAGTDRHVHLPKRELPKFDGEVREWLSFWASFEEIHKDVSLDANEKFHYLLQCMVPESPAYKLVASYTHTGGNYSTAVDALKERFGRTSMLVKVYIRDLLALVVDNSTEGGKLQFVDLVTKLSAQVRSLEKLGVTSHKHGMILYPIVESCIPTFILRDFMKSSDYAEDLGKLMDYLEKEVRREVETQLALSPFSLAPTTGAQKSKKGNSKDIPTATALYTQSGKDPSQESKNKCVFCPKPKHVSQDCRRARNMTSEDKRAFLYERRLCYICFKEAHKSEKCKAQVRCHICSKRHYVIMCPTLDSGIPNVKNEENKKEKSNSTSNSNAEKKDVPNAASSSTFSNLVSSPEVPLQIIPVKVYSSEGISKVVRALIDTGSQKSYVISNLAEECDCEHIGEEEITHQLFGGTRSKSQVYKKVKIHIADLWGNNSCNFDVTCINRISGEIISEIQGPWITEFKTKGVTFIDQSKLTSTVQILIGNDVAPRLYTGEIVDLKYGPVAMNTRFGWVLSGKLPLEQRRIGNSLLVTNCHVVDRPISDLWTLDGIGITDAATTETQAELDRKTQQHFNETVSRSEDGRYEVALPFTSGSQHSLPSNYNIAFRRLNTTTKKLKEDARYELYDKLFQLWEESGIIEQIENDEKENCHYLPHRAVVKLSSATTPIRPVFDASAKEKGKTSLNDCLQPGPNTLELIPAILSRFRLKSVGMTADIEKAFLQIGVLPEHRDFLRFLWWESSDCKRIKIYRHRRVVFGVTSSPFLLGATIQHHLKTINGEEKEIAEELMRSMYADNLLCSVTGQQQASKLKQVAEKLLLPAKFNLRGWELGPTLEEKTVPVLGLLWNTQKDELRVDVTSALTKLDCTATQRNVLSLAHMLFDPLGVISPFTLLAKQILRECHKLKIGWDTPLPEELMAAFSKWKAQIAELNFLQIPRYVKMDQAVSVQLHAFCDASQLATAAAVYLRIKTGTETFVFLMMAKARVAPMTRVTIPRLELLSCLIGARSVSTIKSYLKDQKVPITMWTDSSTALAWITREAPWATFVQNRVKEIRSLTSIEDWRHIGGSDNPADLPSRGATVRLLRKSAFITGPSWLKLPPEELALNQKK